MNWTLIRAWIRREWWLLTRGMWQGYCGTDISDTKDRVTILAARTTLEPKTHRSRVFYVVQDLAAQRVLVCPACAACMPVPTAMRAGLLAVPAHFKNKEPVPREMEPAESLSLDGVCSGSEQLGKVYQFDPVEFVDRLNEYVEKFKQV